MVNEQKLIGTEHRSYILDLSVGLFGRRKKARTDGKI